MTILRITYIESVFAFFGELDAFENDFKVRDVVPDFEFDLSIIIQATAHFDKFLIFHLIILNIGFFRASGRFLLLSNIILFLIFVFIVVLIVLFMFGVLLDQSIQICLAKVIVHLSFCFGVDLHF